MMGGGELEVSKNDPRYTSKLIHVWGGEGLEKLKNWSTWFTDDPLQKKAPQNNVRWEWISVLQAILSIELTFGKNVSRNVFPINDSS